MGQVLQIDNAIVALIPVDVVHFKTIIALRGAQKCVCNQTVNQKAATANTSAMVAILMPAPPMDNSAFVLYSAIRAHPYNASWYSATKSAAEAGYVAEALPMGHSLWSRSA